MEHEWVQSGDLYRLTICGNLIAVLQPFLGYWRLVMYVSRCIDGTFDMSIKDPAGTPHTRNLSLPEAMKLAETLVITGAVC